MKATQVTNDWRFIFKMTTIQCTDIEHSGRIEIITLPCTHTSYCVTYKYAILNHQAKRSKKNSEFPAKGIKMVRFRCVEHF